LENSPEDGPSYRRECPRPRRAERESQQRERRNEVDRKGRSGGFDPFAVCGCCYSHGPLAGPGGEANESFDGEQILAGGAGGLVVIDLAGLERDVGRCDDRLPQRMRANEAVGVVFGLPIEA
jgi:hypothetical protein